MKGLVILNYHGIETPDSPPWEPGEETYALSLEAFRAQIESLVRRRFRCLLPQDLGDWNRGKIEGRAVMITFDDGLASQALAAAPLLEEAGWRGVFFISAGLVGAERMMDEDMLRSLAARGHVIGSHGMNHEALPGLSLERQVDEVCGSRDRLEDILGASVDSFSIPKGFSSRFVEELIFRAGYRHVFSSRYDVCRRGHERQPLPRIAIRRSDGLEAFEALTEDRGGMRICTERAKEIVRNAVPAAWYEKLARMKEAAGGRS